jgi:predicted unusual protein kinase regulating ubiquinone biosynthesis (AarF/ABC1/UbiB family)
MIHLDLHAGNILVKKVPKGGFWEYIIDGISYKVPNLGYQLFIIDFGQAWIPDLFKTGYVKNPHKAYDLQKLFRSTLHFTSSSKDFKTEIRNIIKRIKNEERFEDIINDIWGKMYNKNNVKIIETYNTDKNLKIETLPNTLKIYLKTIKKNIINKKKTPKKL